MLCNFDLELSLNKSTKLSHKIHINLQHIILLNVLPVYKVNNMMQVKNLNYLRIISNFNFENFRPSPFRLLTSILLFSDLNYFEHLSTFLVEQNFSWLSFADWIFLAEIYLNVCREVEAFALFGRINSEAKISVAFNYFEPFLSLNFWLSALLINRVSAV